MKDELISVAREVRKEVEAVAVEKGFKQNLVGMCAHGAFLLHKALKKVGFQSKIKYNHGHCFVVVGDYIVDVTASQFGESKVVVLNTKKIPYCLPSYWAKGVEVEDEVEFSENLKKDKWPVEQIPVK